MAVIGGEQSHELSENVFKYILKFSGPWQLEPPACIHATGKCSMVCGQFASTFALDCQRSRVGQKGTQTKQTDSNADNQAPDFQADGQTDRKTGR